VPLNDPLEQCRRQDDHREDTDRREHDHDAKMAMVFFRSWYTDDFTFSSNKSQKNNTHTHMHLATQNFFDLELFMPYRYMGMGNTPY
jgi:hypothetical protein